MQVAEIVAQQKDDSTEPRRLVVIVDDNHMVLEALSLCLEGWGVDCVAVSSEMEALSALKLSGRCPDLILSDYNLEAGVHGDAVIGAIRHEYGVEIPAMLFTGDLVHGASDARKRKDLNGIPLLTKPVTGRVLKDMISWLKDQP